MKKNKVLQIRESQLRNIKKEATQEAINYSFVIFLNAMRDYEGYGKKRLCRLYARINDLSDSVARGYCSIYDLEKVLYEEAGIVMKGGRFDKGKV
jgi:hypothetical protein